MQQRAAQLVFILLFIATGLCGQEKEMDRLISSELTMNFPSIYFKHNSTDYTKMPYTVDSCINYIALHIKDINELVIWRDSLETEKLTKLRIKKLKTALSKHKETRNVYIELMGQKQKISRHTINMISDSAKINYLLSLNSVFEIAKTRLTKTSASSHGLWLFGTCWKHALSLNPHLNKNGREHCRMDRRIAKRTAVKQ